MRYHEFMDIVVESPQLVAPLDWNLTDPKVNATYAAHFTRYPVEEFRDYPTAKLLVQAGNVGGQIGLLSKITGRLEYYVHYEISDYGVLGHCATQIKLWRARTATVQNLARIGFQEILLKRFDTIISDEQQTDRGAEFWEGQMGALAYSKTVGLLDHKTRIICFDRAEPIEDWIRRQNGWGTNRSFRAKRFFISNLPASALRKG